MSEIQIILLFKLVVREFVGEDKSGAPRRSALVDDIDPSHFGLLAPIESKFRNFEGLAMSAQNRAAAFVEPFGSHADLPCGRPSAFHTPLIHAHAVRDRSGL